MYLNTTIVLQKQEMVIMVQVDSTNIYKKLYQGISKALIQGI